MKKIIFIYLLCSCSFAFSQLTNSISVNWTENKRTNADDIQYYGPSFQGKNFMFDATKKQIFFVEKLKSDTPIDEQNFTVANIVYEPISKESLGDIEANKIPTSLDFTVANSMARDELYIFFRFNPIIREGGTFKRVKSLTYSFSINNKKTFGTTGTNTIVNSALASGDWFRFYVTKSGVYKISKSFLQQLGMNIGDPRNIKIYGQGGRMLPYENSANFPYDITENTIQVIGENDGVMDDQDYVLFYAEGTDNWDGPNDTHLNLYNNKVYYYVTTAGGSGKRIANMPTITSSGTSITSVDDYQFYEKDLFNIGKLGRRWYGEDFSINNEQNFEFSLPNIDTSSPISITVNVAAAAYTETKFNVKANESDLGSISISKITGGLYGNSNFKAYSVTASNNLKINLKYDNAGVPGSKGYLDYITVASKKNLIGYGKQFRFQYNKASSTSGIGEYQFSNANSIGQVWDVTDIYNVTTFQNNNQASFVMKASLGEVRRYVVVDNNDFLTPERDSNTRVANQDLKGSIFKDSQNNFQDVDYLIVTPNFLNAQAENLANFHRNYSKLNVKVVNLETIYSEFSTGMQDIGAIRNFVRYVYQNASTPVKKVKYLCLFGDASYDPKNRILNNTNIVPIYSDLDSFSTGGSFISDDFYGLMDSNEGNMKGVVNDLDIAVGRIPVSTTTDADAMVTKVYEYHDIKSYGRWRNNFTIISDDVDADWEYGLEVGLDKLAQDLFVKKPFINFKKIHSDAYVQESSSGGNRYPKANEDWINAIEQGTLVANYYGHGSEFGLAGERLWNNTDVDKLNNQYKYPLFVTITCEFTRFDNPYMVSGGEQLFLKTKGGAISLVTTTRQIGTLTGLKINTDLANELYGLNSSSFGSMAEALRRAKVGYGGSALMVFYIGDPAIILALPKPKIVLTKVNDVPTTQTTDVFKALATMKISGEVRDENGNTLLSDYNGDLAINIFDKFITRTTLANDGTKDTNTGNLLKMTFIQNGETIFRGNASIKNGTFDFSFVVPRDIRVPVDKGRISFYAKKTNELIDQSGYDDTIFIGGINTNAPTDTTPPQARLFMNDETFVNGGITNESPFLLAKFEDDNGINTASGIGHDIIAYLDGNQTNPYILNDYYETEPNNYKKGKLRFPFRNLAVGLHTIKLKAWDVYNNPIEVDIQFVVVSDDDVTLTNVLNYPNPFVDYTQFWFTHNKPYEPLEVQVQIFTITGKVVWTKNQIITTEGFLSRDIVWDGKDDFGDKIGKGTYVYKLTVKSNLTNKKTEKFEKLVIL